MAQGCLGDYHNSCEFAGGLGPHGCEHIRSANLAAGSVNHRQPDSFPGGVLSEKSDTIVGITDRDAVDLGDYVARFKASLFCGHALKNLFHDYAIMRCFFRGWKNAEPHTEVSALGRYGGLYGKHKKERDQGFLNH